MKYHDITPEMTIGDLVKSKVYGDFGTHIFTDMTPDHWNAPLASYGFEKSASCQPYTAWRNSPPPEKTISIRSIPEGGTHE